MHNENDTGDIFYTYTLNPRHWDWYEPQYHSTMSASDWAGLLAVTEVVEPRPARYGFENVWHFVEPIQETDNINEPDDNALDAFLAEFKVIPSQEVAKGMAAHE